MWRWYQGVWWRLQGLVKFVFGFMMLSTGLAISNLVLFGLQLAPPLRNKLLWKFNEFSNHVSAKPEDWEKTIRDVASLQANGPGGVGGGLFMAHRGG